ncbi:MAG: hypothetical protein LBR85_05710 [Oscillospiraceae bacterium]|nr:hypothetical protein [Oscillospiraceae bacterium]
MRTAAFLLALAALTQAAVAKPLRLYTDYSQMTENAKLYGSDGAKYLSALGIVSDLGIMGSNPAMNDGASLTRAEFYVMIYVLRNGTGMTAPYAHALSNETIPFDDIKPGEWHYPYFVWAYQRALTFGVAARQMGPDVRVDYFQCLQALMAVLGNSNARSGIDYSNQVAVLAFAETTFRLSRAFIPKDEMSLTRGETAVLISHMLEANPITYSETGAVVKDEKTYREIYFDV